MASTVAKFAVYNINNEDFLSSRKISKSMEEDVVLDQLCDDSFAQRSEILDNLRTEARKHGGRLPFQNMLALFRALSRALTDTNWTVRHLCVQLISEMIAGLEDDLDGCMSIVLPRLVANIGDSKVALRKAVIQTLHLYMKHSNDVQHVFHAIVEHGLENQDPKVRTETTVNFPLLLTAEFAKQDLFTVTQALARRLDHEENDESKIAVISLERIRALVGDSVFDSYIHRLSKPVRHNYFQLTNRNENGYDSHIDVNSNSSKSLLGGSAWNHSHDHEELENLEFGIIPKHVMDQLVDQNDLRIRAQGVEELRKIVRSQSDTTPLLPHVLGFISFLCNLLDDVNFKVSTMTLDIFGTLVNKLGQGVKPYLKSLMSALTKRLGDNQIVIRQANMKVLMDLMQILTPKPVLNLLSDCLQHRNSRVREEALNVVIASLLTFPSYDFDLGQLCQTIAHTLVDPKRRVRQASLEAFAVLAQAMGPGRLQPLVSAVDSVELSMEGDGVMGAVQARLARRQLPRLNKDGMVEYSNPLPASATTRGSPPSADIEWIMAAAGGGTSSARDRHHSDHHSRELSQPTSARSTSGSNENTGPTPAPRRYHSAGRNRKKLPWEELPSEESNVEVDHSESSYKSHPNSAPSHKRLIEDKPPLKARNTWSDLDDNNDHAKSYRLIKSTREHSPDTGSGSYRQIHLNKLKRERDRASLGSHPTAFGVPGEDQTGSHSAPVADRGETDLLAGGSKKRNGRQDSKDRDDKYFPSFGTAKDEEFLAQRKSLANSWPDPAKDTSPKPRKRIDPLSEPSTPSTSYPPEWPGAEESPKKNKVNQSPIPLKPTIVRSATRKTKHVPPLVLSDKSSKPLDIDMEHDSAYGASAKREDDFDDDDDDSDDFNEMQNSLQSLRNSAARKRAARKSDLSNPSRSPSPPFDESGIYSVLYDSLESSPKNTPKKKGKKPSDSPFSTKPRVARTSGSEKESPDTSRELEPNPFEFSPTGGVTFRDKVKSDVSVVGQGYGKQDNNQISHTYSSSSLNQQQQQQQQRTDSPPIPTHARGNARERRRQTKGNMVSPLTMASLNHPGPVDNEDFSEEVGVVGKGMFNTSYAPPTHEFSSDKNKRSKDRKDSDGGQYKSPKGVYGVYGRGVKQNSQDDNDSSDEELSTSILMSKSTKDKMAKKQMEMEQKKAEKQAEKEKRQKERELWYKQQEKERERAREQQLEKLKQMETFTEDIAVDTLTISGSGSSAGNTPTKSRNVIGKPPVATTPKKKLTKSPSSVSDSSSTKANSSPLHRTQSLNDADDGEELKAFGNPDSALRDALRFMSSDDWEVKIDGLNYIKRLSIFHPDTICSQLHTVIVAVLAEMKNLRSSVSRLAICVVAEMFAQLKSNMDKDLDQLCKGLLQKAGESNGFIREDVDRSLAAMVSCATPQRALIALIAGGGSHRNVAVRKACAQFLVDVVTKMGPGRLLSGIKDVTDKILPTAVAFCLDPNPETRYYGRKIMYQLMNHEDFEKLLVKYVSQKDLRPLKDIIERLRQDGLGEMPSDTPSARARRSNASSGSGSRSNSGSREKTKSASSDFNGLTPPGSTRKVRRSPRMDEASMEQVKDLRAALSANDWRDRHRAIQNLQDLCETNLDLIASNIVKIFDDFTPRLSDSNSKVNLTALNTMLHLVPRLREYLGAVINTVVPVLGTNLASKNPQIHHTTSEVLDSLMEHMENSLLLQPFANLAQFGNQRVKPDMIEKLAYLSSKVYSRKHQSVTRYVLPVLWHLLSNTTGSGAVPGGTGNIRTATSSLANSLFALMGQSMLDQAQSNLNPRNLKTLQDMLENP